MPVLITFAGLSNGRLTPFDGKYLKEYDPGRDGVDPSGRPMIAHIVVTDDPASAMHFIDAAHAWEEWKRIDPRRPIRPDGKPNRPLTAFTIDIGPVP